MTAHDPASAAVDPAVATPHAPGSAAAGGDDESLGALLSRLMSDVTALFRQEVELAKAELRAEGSRAAKAAGMVAGAAGAALLAALLLSFALAWLLAEAMPTWLGFLIVGVVYAIVAAVLAKSGRTRMQQIDPVPQQTVETLKEDVQWAKNR